MPGVVHAAAPIKAQVVANRVCFIGFVPLSCKTVWAERCEYSLNTLGKLNGQILPQRQPCGCAGKFAHTGPLQSETYIMSDTAPLFAPIKIRGLTVPNRVVMAPMTRSFSPGGVPGENVADYYARRGDADVGLIVTEGTTVDRGGASNDPKVPNFHAEDALSGWANVVDAAAQGAVVPVSGPVAHVAVERPVRLRFPCRPAGQTHLVAHRRRRRRPATVVEPTLPPRRPQRPVRRHPEPRRRVRRRRPAS